MTCLLLQVDQKSAVAVRADCLSYLKSLVSNSGFGNQLLVLVFSGATG